MSDIIKIREWIDSDEPEPADGWDWPHPPVYIESRIVGNLRRDILAKFDRNEDDACEVRIIEGEIEGGYSEYTSEMDYSIEVWLDEGRQSQKVREFDSYSNPMPAFLAWIDEAP